MSDQKAPQTYSIVGVAMEVHRELGQGFLEPVYQQALALEFTERNILFHREVPLEVIYKQTVLGCSYRADFICFDEVIVELKALPKLTNIEYAQVINYLKATGFTRALLINFGALSLEYKRFVYTHKR